MEVQFVVCEARGKVNSLCKFWCTVLLLMLVGGSFLDRSWFDSEIGSCGTRIDT